MAPSGRHPKFDAILDGIFSLMSFSLYRAAHQLHHAYLASERDEELWPFVRPEMPRASRIRQTACGNSPNIRSNPSGAFASATVKFALMPSFFGKAEAE